MNKNGPVITKTTDSRQPKQPQESKIPPAKHTCELYQKKKITIVSKITDKQTQ